MSISSSLCPGYFKFRYVAIYAAQTEENLLPDNFCHEPNNGEVVPRTPRVGDEEILSQIALHPDPVVTAQELSNHVDYTPDGIRRRLHTLHDKGLVTKREVGANAVVWWLTDEGRAALA